jgi:hypothetical protein
MLVVEELLLSLVLALACAAFPWLTRQVRSALLAFGLVIGLVLSVLGSVFALPLYPWSNLLVLLIAVTGGLLLGRVMPPRFRPMLILLLLLSALDVAQIALTGGLGPLSSNSPASSSSAPAPGPLLYLNVLLLLPTGHYRLGIFDLLVLTAIAEQWRRRGASYLLAVLPGLVGFLLAYGALWLTKLGGWPLLPFFTAGWLCSEAVARLSGAYRSAMVRARR